MAECTCSISLPNKVTPTTHIPLQHGLRITRVQLDQCQERCARLEAEVGEGKLAKVMLLALSDAVEIYFLLQGTKEFSTTWDWISSRFVRHGHRPPTPSEAQQFARLLPDPLRPPGEPPAPASSSSSSSQ